MHSTDYNQELEYENTYLRQEVEELKKIIQEYQQREVSVCSPRSDCPTSVQSQRLEKSSDNKTYIICNDIPSLVINTPTVNISPMTQDNKLKEQRDPNISQSYDQNLLNVQNLQPQKTPQLKQPYTQQLVKDVRIKDIKKALEGLDKQEEKIQQLFSKVQKENNCRSKKNQKQIQKAYNHFKVLHTELEKERKELGELQNQLVQRLQEQQVSRQNSAGKEKRKSTGSSIKKKKDSLNSIQSRRSSVGGQNLGQRRKSQDNQASKRSSQVQSTVGTYRHIVSQEEQVVAQKQEQEQKEEISTFERNIQSRNSSQLRPTSKQGQNSSIKQTFTFNGNKKNQQLMSLPREKLNQSGKINSQQLSYYNYIKTPNRKSDFYNSLCTNKRSKSCQKSSLLPPSHPQSRKESRDKKQNLNHSVVVVQNNATSLSFSDQQLQDLTFNEKLLIEEFKKFLIQKQQENSMIQPPEIINQSNKKPKRPSSILQDSIEMQSEEIQITEETEFKSVTIVKERVPLQYKPPSDQQKRRRDGTGTRHCKNCMSLLSRGLSSALCREHPALLNRNGRYGRL